MIGNAGWPLFYAGAEGASIGFRKLIRRLRDHIELGAPLAESDVEFAASDPAALGSVAIRTGYLYGNAKKEGRARDWPAALARANRLAEEIVIRQVRMLTWCRRENRRLREELEKAKEETHA